MRKAAGFTLLELLFGLFLLMSMTLLAFPIMLNLQRMSAEKAARAHLNSVLEGVRARYEQSSGSADPEDYKLYLWGASAAPLPSYGGAPAGDEVSLADQIPVPGSCFNAYQDFAAQLITTTSGAPPRGGKGPVAATCYLVSKRIPTSSEGLVVPYHTVAIVWPGADGKFSKKSTFNYATGSLHLEGDDRGVTMNGRAIQERKVKATLDALRKVRDLYEDYYTIRFLSDPDRTVGRDYFYASAGDDGGDIVTGALVPSTQEAGDTRASVILARLMGSSSSSSTVSAATLSVSLTTPWGTPIEVANRPSTTFRGGLSPEIRAPGAIGYLGVVPFTAIVAAQIPGGDDVTFDSYAVVTAVGRY